MQLDQADLDSVHIYPTPALSVSVLGNIVSLGAGHLERSKGSLVETRGTISRQIWLFPCSSRDQAEDHVEG